LIIGRFVVKVDSNGPVVAGLAGGVAHGSSSGQRVRVADDPTWGNACAIARGWEDVEAFPLNWVECEKGGDSQKGECPYPQAYLWRPQSG
jgi:hypothetical protein